MLATVLDLAPLSGAALLTVALPAGVDARTPTGRFFLARAGDGSLSAHSWTPMLRRTLFTTRVELRSDRRAWTLLVPEGEDPGHAWLRTRTPGARIDLLGPYGVGLEPPPAARALLLAADVARAPLLFPLVDTMLDRGGQVTLLLVEGAEDVGVRAALLARLPLAVEARIETAGALPGALSSLARWADLLVLALPAQPDPGFGALAHALRAARFRLDPGFAHALLDAPLPCGVGACLGCIVPLAGGGFTRACMHGPLFDLTRLG